MAIMKPNEMDFSQKNLIMILSGTPGLGKTTLAQSAPNTITIDSDNGMCRVNPNHRKAASICKTYDELKNDIAVIRQSGEYKTIVVDTGGALIEMMKQFIIEHPQEFPGGAQRAVSVLSQKGYGYVKQMFLDFSAELRRDFNVIFVFHEQKSKDEDTITYDIICEGSAKTLVYQPADLAAHMFMQNGKRYLGFTPTEQYFAKGAYGIKGLVEVPELKDGDTNDFLSKLFLQIRKNLKDSQPVAEATDTEYEEVMKAGLEVIASLNKPDEVEDVKKIIDSMQNVRTSQKELLAKLKERMKELNIVYVKGQGYAYKQDKV